MIVCGYAGCQPTTAGCEHTNPALRVRIEHRCEPPPLGSGPTYSRRLPWTCGVCGRVWSMAVAGALCWWEETQGPRLDPTEAPKREDWCAIHGVGVHECAHGSWPIVHSDPTEAPHG